MRQIQQQIKVGVDSLGQPKCLRYLDRQRTVERIVDSWRYGGEWWRGQPGRDYYQLDTEDNQKVVVYLEDGSGQWILALLVD